MSTRDAIRAVSTTGIRPSDLADYLKGVVRSAGSPLNALASILCIAFTGDPESPRVLVAYIDRFVERLGSGISAAFQLPPDARAIASVAINGDGVIAVEAQHGLVTYAGFGEAIGAIKTQLLDAVSLAGATLLLSTPPDVNNRALIAADGLPWRPISVGGAPTRCFRFVPGTPDAIAVTGSRSIAIASTLTMERMVGEGEGWRKTDSDGAPFRYASLAYLSRVAEDCTVFVTTYRGRKVKINVGEMRTDDPDTYRVDPDSAIMRIEGTVIGAVDVLIEGRRHPSAAYAFALPDDGMPNGIRVAYIPAKEIGNVAESRT